MDGIEIRLNFKTTKYNETAHGDEGTGGEAVWEKKEEGKIGNGKLKFGGCFVGDGPTGRGWKFPRPRRRWRGGTIVAGPGGCHVAARPVLKLPAAPLLLASFPDLSRFRP